MCVLVPRTEKGSNPNFNQQLQPSKIMTYESGFLSTTKHIPNSRIWHFYK